jgi:octaprenyl-diphosphate synthase
LNQVRELIEERLAVPSRASDIRGLLEHANIGGGKMIRPGLVLLCGACCGGITDNHIRVAAIMEMIHNATLLHDDVIDEGQKRRGRPTINSLWGNESAVLAGDFLLSRVFRMCSELESEVARIIATAAVRVCEGELRQVAQRRNWGLSEGQYIDIITEKSASLFSSSCHLGGLLAQANSKEVRSLADFGLNTGIAFQIADDLLDIVGDEKTTGKTLGSDADKNKPTLAVIHLLKAADERERAAIENQSAVAPEGAASLTEMLKRHGSLDYARMRAKEFVDKAVGALSVLEESDAKEALVETARFVVSRVG